MEPLREEFNFSNNIMEVWDKYYSGFSFESILKSLDYIDQYNEIREEEGLDASYTSLGIMIASAASVDATGKYYYDHKLLGHQNLYPALNENIFWGSTQFDPYEWWYIAEKELYETGHTDYPGVASTGHYGDIVNPNNILTGFGAYLLGQSVDYTMEYEAMGFYDRETKAYGTYSQHFATLVSDGNRSYSLDDLRSMSASNRQALGIYTTDELRALINEYQSIVTEAETAVTAAENELKAAQDAVAALQTRLSQAQAAVTTAQNDVSAKQAAVTAAENTLASAQATLSQKEQAYDNAVTALNEQKEAAAAAANTVGEALTAMTEAETARTEALGMVETQQKVVDGHDETVASAQSDMEAKKEIRDAFSREVAECEEALGARQDELTAANNELSDRKADLTSANEALTAAKAALTEDQGYLEDARQLLLEVTNVLSDKRGILADKQAALDEITAKLENITAAQAKLDAALANVDAKNAAFDEAASIMSQANLALMQAREALTEAQAVLAEAKTLPTYEEALASYKEGNAVGGTYHSHLAGLLAEVVDTQDAYENVLTVLEEAQADVTEAQEKVTDAQGRYDGALVNYTFSEIRYNELKAIEEQQAAQTGTGKGSQTTNGTVQAAAVTDYTVTTAGSVDTGDYSNAFMYGILGAASIAAAGFAMICKKRRI